MKRLLPLFLLGVAQMALAEETYLGMFLQGSKIGYTSYISAPTKLDGVSVTRSDSRTRMGAGMLGSDLQIEIDSTTWTSASGRPVRMSFAMRSAGREQKVDAVFGNKNVTIDIDNSGTKTKKTIALPSGAPIVDDPLPLVAAGSKARSFFVLDPTTVSFVKNEVKLLGQKPTTVKGKKVTANAIQVIDPRASTVVWLSSKGDLIKAEAPMGIEMLPMTRREALGKVADGPRVDLASATSLRADKPLEDPDGLTGLTVRFTGRDMSRVPSDTYQTTTGSGETWTIDVHPPKLTAVASATIADAARQKPDWVKPGLNIPSNSERFTKLAKEVVGDSKDVQSAALKIRSWVKSQLRPNAGIGVLRDANDVLNTKEGVCRDYAILAATISRAAGIPTRLVSGLVNWDGTFYYHAWIEVWDGTRWLGIDPTGGSDQISAAHIKLADGNVEDAFTFTFLDRVKVNVLSLKRS